MHSAIENNTLMMETFTGKPVFRYVTQCINLEFTVNYKVNNEHVLDCNVTSASTAKLTIFHFYIFNKSVCLSIFLSFFYICLSVCLPACLFIFSIEIELCASLTVNVSVNRCKDFMSKKDITTCRYVLSMSFPKIIQTSCVHTVIPELSGQGCF